MSTTPETGTDGFDVVVGSDGTLTVPAAELARHGVRPGSHLRLVPEPVPARRRSTRGLLAGTVSPEGVDAMIQALDEAKADRIAQVAADAG
jgi:hypothetical protein